MNSQEIEGVFGFLKRERNNRRGKRYSRVGEQFLEVKGLGGKNSTLRTAEQSEIARYWYEGLAQGWSRIARVVAAQRGLDRWDNARLLALVNAAIADGFIAR